MDSSNVWMLWIGFGALSLLGLIVLCLVLFVVVRAAALSALRAHSREMRTRAARTGAIDIVPGLAIPQTQSVQMPSAPATGIVPETAAAGARTATHPHSGKEKAPGRGGPGA